MSLHSSITIEIEGELLTENCVCTFDTVHHVSNQSKPHSIGRLKEKFGVYTLSLPSISMVLPSISFSDNMVMLFFQLYSDTHRENLFFSSQFKSFFLYVKHLQPLKT